MEKEIKNYTELNLADLVSQIEAALPRIRRFVPSTPVFQIPDLNQKIKGEVLLKAECLNPTGSFKIRGAINAMTLLKENYTADKVIAFSSGNHGIAVSYSARCLEQTAWVVVPKDIPLVKLEWILKLGSEVIFYDRDKEDREYIVQQLSEKCGIPIVKPFDDLPTISGQGTCATEFISQTAGPIDSAIVCTGGGGLMAGIGTYLKETYPAVSLFTAEPQGWEDHKHSLTVGALTPALANGSSLCDALLARTPGKLTFKINLANRVIGLSATDEMIIYAMLYIWQTLGIRLEPSGSVALACLLAHAEHFEGQRVLITLTGRNVDKECFTKCIKLARQSGKPKNNRH